MKWPRAVLWAWLFLVGAVVEAGPAWRWSNPAPQGASVFDIANFGSLTMQVGEWGQIYASDDLNSWMPRRTGVTNHLRSALFLNGRLVVSGANGLILYTQADGMSRFNQVNLNTTDWLEGLATDGTRLVAVGDNGAIYTSLNLTNWTRLNNAGDWLTSVAYGNGKYVAVGLGGYVTTSSDGANWSSGTRLTSNDLNKVTYLPDGFWILGNGGFVRSSTNGTSWAPINVGTTNDLFDAASDGIETVVVGRSELRTSSSPYLFWNSRVGASPAPPPWTYYVAHFDGSQFIVGGRSGMLVEGFRTNATSALTWSSDSESPRNWLWSLASVEGLFVATGEAGGIFTSEDGFAFTQEGVPDSARNEILEGVGGNTNLLISVGTSGTVIYSQAGFTNVTFTNDTGQVVTEQVNLLGLVWNAVTPKPATNELQGVGVFGNMYIVSGGQGKILTSLDGMIWTGQVSGVTTMLSSIAASPTRVVVVGDSGVVLSSLNGIVWTPRSSGVTNWIYQARYLNGQFVAVGEAGLILTSPDGITWTRRNSGTTVWLNSLTYAQSNYYAVGTSGTMLRSPDAITWERLPNVSTKSLYGVGGNAKTIVTVGVEGVILRARLVPYTTPVNFTQIALQATGVVFLGAGELDQPFELSNTADFNTWTVRRDLEVIDNSGVQLFVDGFGRAAYLFYRTRLLPE
jgi:hypothetical protein